MITKLVVAAALASAAAATGAVVLTTSGPLANHTTDNGFATPSSLAGTVTAGPTNIPITPTTLAGPLRPDDLFEFSALPPVSQSGWKTYSAPNGTFTFRAPADWVVRMSPIQPPNGPPLGDAADIRKPGSDGASIAPGVTACGWLEVAISTQPFQVDLNLAGFETTVRTNGWDVLRWPWDGSGHQGMYFIGYPLADSYYWYRVYRMDFQNGYATFNPSGCQSVW